MIGQQIVLKTFLAEQKWRRTEDLMFPLVQGVHLNSFLTSVILVSKAQISTDPFIGAEVFKAGLIESLILGLAIMLFTQLSLYLFSRCWEFARAYSYREVWAVTFGSTYAWLPSVFLVVLYWTYNFTASWEVVAYPQCFLPALWPGCPAFLLDQWVLLWLVSVVLVLPCSFVRRFSQLSGLAYVSFFALLVGLICLILHFVRRASNIGFDPDNQLVYFNNDVEMLLACAQNFNVCFFLHPFMAIILKDMESPSTSRCMNVAWAANLLCFVLNSVGGVFGYLLFDPDLPGFENVFPQLPLQDPEVIIGVIASYLVSALSLTYFALYNAHVVCNLVLGKQSENRVCLFTAALCQVTAYIFSTYAGDKFSEVLHVIAEFASVCLAFVLPPGFYLAQFKFTRKGLAVVAIATLVVGVAFGASICAQSVRALIDEWPEL
jgi:hypothetical protein